MMNLNVLQKLASCPQHLRLGTQGVSWAPEAEGRFVGSQISALPISIYHRCFFSGSPVETGFYKIQLVRVLGERQPQSWAFPARKPQYTCHASALGTLNPKLSQQTPGLNISAHPHFGEHCAGSVAPKGSTLGAKGSGGLVHTPAVVEVAAPLPGCLSSDPISSLGTLPTSVNKVLLTESP